MSIRMGLLAVVGREATHAYEIKQRFEARTGAAWPVNMGQVSATLASLLKADLVESVEVDPVGYRRTAAGDAVVRDWWADGGDRVTPERDEVLIKVTLAVADPDVDLRAVVRTQRESLLAAMRDLRRAADVTDPIWSVVLDRQQLQAEADLRWLDLVEGRAKRRGPATPSTTPAPAPAHERVGG